MKIQDRQKQGQGIGNFTPKIGLLTIGVVVCGSGRSGAQEQEVIEAGKREFQRSCASCHGLDARGSGPGASTLNVKPADLTQLRKNRRDTFFFWQTYDQISGRSEAVVRGHGTREMSIWEERFRLDARVSEEYALGVRGRLLSLVHYVQSIQAP